MRLSPTVVRSLREGALWVFGAMALIVLAALVTYDRNDPSFATTGEPGPLSNIIGRLARTSPGLLVLLFGAPAFLVSGHDWIRRLAAVPWIARRQGAGRRAPRWLFGPSASC